MQVPIGTAPISPTTITPTSNGTAILTIYLETTTAGTAGTITCTVTWTDDAGTTTITTTPLSLATTGRTSTITPIFIAPTTNLQYATNFTGATGSPGYKLYIKVTKT